MTINAVEMLVLFVLVWSFWAMLLMSGHGRLGTRPHLPSATENGPDTGVHLCRRGIAPFLKHRQASV